MKRALIIGSNGTIGAAMTDLARKNYSVSTLSQQDSNYTDEDLMAHAEQFKEQGNFDLIVCCIGVLHNTLLTPEKRLFHLDEARLAEYFRINVIIPSLCLKAFSPLLKRSDNASFIFLSAMVGSITDNDLGGWYGYRSSKAALNMMIKTASIELSRTNKNASIVAVHPGTTRGSLSKPFASRVADNKYYTAEQTSERLLGLAESFTAKDSGNFYNWDGSTLPW